MSFLRRIRGTASLAALWGLAFLPLGLMWFLWGLPFLPPNASVLRSLLERLALALVYGTICGGLFALMLATISRWRPVLLMRRTVAARWGAVTGFFFPAITTVAWALDSGSASRIGIALVSLGLSTALGAACGASTLALAARSPATLPPQSEAERLLRTTP
jgi:hypothetical protein